jgi:hypothetical protein
MGGKILHTFRMPKQGPRGRVREYQAKQEATSVCSLLGSSAKERRGVTVLRADHQNSVQKESATSGFDARRWKRDLSSLMKGVDIGSWLTEIGVSGIQKTERTTNVQLVHAKCQAPASRHGRGPVRPCSVEKPRPSWLSQRADVPQDLSHYGVQEGLHRSCFYHELGEACVSCS